MARRGTAYLTVDPDRQGKQIGTVNIPHSPHDDAWGTTQIPIAVIGNGTGPTVILTGGNHGDEYEGPITLGELIRELDPAAVQGRLIILPALNIPAVMAGTRTSPVDGLNLNRTYPGDPAGTLSRQISAFMCDVLYPLADAFIDLHSGGSSLDILPSAIIEPAPTEEHHRRNVAAVTAFGAPLAVVISNPGQTSTSSAVQAGLTTVGTEMAGGGTVTIDALRLCRRGARNVLAHLGVLEGTAPERPPEEQALLEIPGETGHVFSNGDGVFEPFHENGTKVSAGQPAGRIHFLDDPARQPADLIYRHDGIVYGRRQPGRVRRGSCCLVVAAPYRGFPT